MEDHRRQAALTCGYTVSLESSARKWAGSNKGCWRVAGSKVLQVSLPSSYWDRLGLKTLSQTWQRLNPTA